MTRRDYATAVLEAAVGVAHPGAVRGLLVVFYAESGSAPCTGLHNAGAEYNPPNSTLSCPGSTNYRTTPPLVKNYPTLGAGVVAVANNLKESRYDALRAVLAEEGVTAFLAVGAWGDSEWGTDKALAFAVLHDYNREILAQGTNWPAPYATLAVGSA